MNTEKNSEMIFFRIIIKYCCLCERIYSKKGARLNLAHLVSSLSDYSTSLLMFVEGHLGICYMFSTMLMIIFLVMKERNKGFALTTQLLGGKYSGFSFFFLRSKVTTMSHSRLQG